MKITVPNITLLMVSALSFTNVIAATSQSIVIITATVPTTCGIATLAHASFNYDPMSLNATMSMDNSGAQISTNCTAGTTATVTLDQGQNPAPGSTDSTPLRQLVFKGVTLNQYLTYSVFSDATYTTPWTNVATGGIQPTYSGGQAVPANLYIRVNAGQQVSAGTYSDILIATLTY